MKLLFILALIPSFLVAQICNDLDRIYKTARKKLKVEHVKERWESTDNYYYRVSAKNASPDKDYTLVSRSLNRACPMTEEARVDSSGMVVYKRGGFPMINLDSYPGEPMLIYLVANDLTEIGFTKIIHRPLCTSNNGYKLSIELIDANCLNFFMEATGFEPEEEVSINSRSGHELRQGRGKADIHGRLGGVLSPAIMMATKGIAKCEIIGKKGGVSIDYPWGEQ